jgi:pyruvate kinase
MTTQHPLRRTKIVVTLGPALDDQEVLRSVIVAGADVFRANFSHGSLETHEKRIQMVRQLADECGKTVAILADMQGPKIRIGRFKNKSINLEVGQNFLLDTELDSDAGTTSVVSLDYKELPNDVRAGDTLLLDDGRVVMQVEKAQPTRIYCKVTVGGELSNNKGINRLGGGLSAAALTDKDRVDIIEAVRLQADFIAISFPRNAEDVKEARALLKAAGGNAGIIAKIERAEAMINIDEIIRTADAVMVARGDLGVEIGDAELPGAQKRIIHLAKKLNKPVITATQMLESMTYNTIPTRAEVSDVANAVLDGTDAVMLSGETAVGKYPEKAVAAMDRICLSAEKTMSRKNMRRIIDPHFKFVDEAIAMATMYTANHLDIKAIIALTESGTTPLWMSCVKSSIPIYGLSRHLSTQRRMALYRGVYPIPFDATHINRNILNQTAVGELQKRKLVKEGDNVIITKGDLIGVHGRTNSMKIFTVTSDITTDIENEKKKLNKNINTEGING